MKKKRGRDPIQPVSGTKVPRFAGPSNFARLPELRDVESCDVAIVGIPFDAGTSYRPGARFGPQSIRQASRHLRTNYHPNYDVEPFKVQQVADAGGVANLAGGGIAKLAGVSSGPPPESGPNSQGLQGLMQRVRNC